MQTRSSFFLFFLSVFMLFILLMKYFYQYMKIYLLNRIKLSIYFNLHPLKKIIFKRVLTFHAAKYFQINFDKKFRKKKKKKKKARWCHRRRRPRVPE